VTARGCRKISRNPPQGGLKQVHPNRVERLGQERAGGGYGRKTTNACLWPK
jgi:hypothetical protein